MEPPERAQGSSVGAFTPFFIAIAGGTASGKTTVCRSIIQSLGDQRVVVISTDDFYRDLAAEESANPADVNFDDPGMLDVPALMACLDQLQACQKTEVPEYDFEHNRRCAKGRPVSPSHVIIVEGIFALHFPELLERVNMKVFVDTDDDVRLVRRIKRDTMERGRNVEGVLAQYVRFVKPAFDNYVLPSKHNADVIIPWLEDNPVAVNLITEHIRSKLSIQDLRRVYSNLYVMPSTMQTRGMHTKIRSRTTARGDFVFYADRLIRLVVEYALSKLPFKDCSVTTPCGDGYVGIDFQGKICGVAIIRSGEAMENALRSCCQGVKVGKILINRDLQGACTVAYEKLPHDIASRHVLVLDPVLSTGNTVLRVVDVLTRQRSVQEENIVLLSLVAAPQGIQRVCSRHPRLQVVTTEIDQEIGDRGVRPGVGDFGDRYFGTGSAAGEYAPTLSEEPLSASATPPLVDLSPAQSASTSPRASERSRRPRSTAERPTAGGAEEELEITGWPVRQRPLPGQVAARASVLHSGAVE